MTHLLETLPFALLISTLGNIRVMKKKSMWHLTLGQVVVCDLLFKIVEQICTLNFEGVVT